VCTISIHICALDTIPIEREREREREGEREPPARACVQYQYTYVHSIQYQKVLIYGIWVRRDRRESYALGVSYIHTHIHTYIHTYTIMVYGIEGIEGKAMP